MTAVVSRWQGGYRCLVSARTHEWTADEPESVGGGDAGPTPTELLLGALASCFLMAIWHIAKRDDVELPEDLEVHVDGTYDGPRFSALRVQVHGDADYHAAIEELLPRAARVCYVSNTLRRVPDISYEVASS